MIIWYPPFAPQQTASSSFPVTEPLAKFFELDLGIIIARRHRALEAATVGNNNCKTAPRVRSYHRPCSTSYYDPAVNWYQLLPIRILVPVLTDPLGPGLATAGPPETLTLTWPYYGTGSYRPDTDGPPDPAVFWYPFLQTRYGRPARPCRILVPVLTDRIRTARPTRPYFGTRFYRPDTDGPPDPAVFWYPFLQTGYGRPARPGRILVPVLTDRIRTAARPGRILVPVLTDQIRTARPTRPYFGTGSSRPYTAGSTGPGRVGSQTGTLVTYVNCFDPVAGPVNTLK
ncbi:hypothetical protein BC829DRAFT_423641 [Chytridium lagenaria]|nr:hypothetical protein BC829DRAFT_423641 [Chytridium lagenaria]